MSSCRSVRPSVCGMQYIIAAVHNSCMFLGTDWPADGLYSSNVNSTDVNTNAVATGLSGLGNGGKELVEMGYTAGVEVSFIR